MLGASVPFSGALEAVGTWLTTIVVWAGTVAFLVIVAVAGLVRHPSGKSEAAAHERALPRAA